MVYVIGAARSGSTLLDTILGAHPQIESLGELCNLVRHGWLWGEYCACGEPGIACPFWCDVRREWTRRVGPGHLKEYDALLRRVEWSRQWWIDLAGRTPPPEFRCYASWTAALLQAIRVASGRPILVDSSKLRSRGRALAWVPGLDLRLIHLVRDVRGVVWSIQKRLARDPRGGLPRGTTPRPTWRTALGWSVANLQAERVCRRLPRRRSLRVRYEDLVANPLGTLGRIGAAIGVDLSDVARRLAQGQPIRVGHPIAGNRMRMAGAVRLQPDLHWQRNLSSSDRWLCLAFSGALMRRYGYTGDRSATPAAGDWAKEKAA